MTDVVLDANMLLLPFQFSVDVVSEIERILGVPDIYTLDLCVDEAKRAEGGTYEALVEKLLSTQDITVIETSHSGHTDYVLIEYGEAGYIVATVDTDLKRALREKGLPYIQMRENAYLELVGE